MGNLHANSSCFCNKIPAFIHELNQYLFVINVYIKVCLKKNDDGDLDSLLLSDILEKINKQNFLIEKTINHLINNS